MTTDPYGTLPPPIRRPGAILGIGITGLVMGAVDAVPGFSSGTVAIVAGIYVRLLANIRQGARALALLLRGRAREALRALAAVDWVFLGVLLVCILVAVFSVAPTLHRLIEERPVEMSAALLGLVLGATVLASRELRRPRAWHALLWAVAAVATFVGLGVSPGALPDPSLLALFGGGVVAISAMILPGISGAFVLLLLGLYPAVIALVAERSLGPLAVFALGCVVGLALFGSLLHWLLARWHDVVLAVLLGVMAGSARVLWPWPSTEDFGSPVLGAPERDTLFLVVALALGTFALVWMLGLAATGVSRSMAEVRARRAVRRAAKD